MKINKIFWMVTASVLVGFGWVSQSLAQDGKTNLQPVVSTPIGGSTNVPSSNNPADTATTSTSTTVVTPTANDGKTNLNPAVSSTIGSSAAPVVSNPGANVTNAVSTVPSSNAPSASNAPSTNNATGTNGVIANPALTNGQKNNLNPTLSAPIGTNTNLNINTANRAASALVNGVPQTNGVTPELSHAKDPSGVQTSATNEVNPTVKNGVVAAPLEIQKQGQVAADPAQAAAYTTAYSTEPELTNQSPKPVFPVVKADPTTQNLPATSLVPSKPLEAPSGSEPELTNQSPKAVFPVIKAGPTTQNLPPVTIAPSSQTDTPISTEPALVTQAPKPVFPANNSGSTATQLPAVSILPQASSQAAPVKITTDPGSCGDQAKQAIFAILKNDKANVLSIMFELTAMRLALRTLEQTPQATTLEELTHLKISSLDEQLKNEKTAGEVQDQVLGVYQKYGEATDVKKVLSDAENYGKMSQEACYWNKNTRLSNEDTAAYVLAVSASEPAAPSAQSNLSEIDAATLWVVEHARNAAAKDQQNPRRHHYDVGNKIVAGDAVETEKNGYGNLLNVSTRVARYLGGIKGARRASKETLKAEITAEEKKITDALESIYQDPVTQAELTKCAAVALKKEGLDPNCVDCLAKKKEEFHKEQFDIKSIQEGLLLEVTKSQGLAMKQELKFKLGESTFDFSNFAKSVNGETIPTPALRGKRSVCGPKHLQK